MMLFLIYSSCNFGQELSKLVRNKTIEKNNQSLAKYHIVDYTLIDNNQQISINNEGIYQYADSSLVNGILYIYLTKTNDVNQLYGWCNGKIIDGKKEGRWIHELYVNKRKSVLVKEMNYTKGQLNGDYYVYNISGNILFFVDYFEGDYNITRESGLSILGYGPNDNKPTTHFKNGTGYYEDYFYDTGLLKEKGELIDGIKNGQWYIYNKSGEVIKVENYCNGFLINR